MGWYNGKKEITKDDYTDIKAGKKSLRDFFSTAEIAGYGAIPSMPYEDNGKYYIPFGISDSCD